MSDSHPEPPLFNSKTASLEIDQYLRSDGRKLISELKLKVQLLQWININIQVSALLVKHLVNDLLWEQLGATEI